MNGPYTASEGFPMSVAVPYARPKLCLALWTAGMLGFALVIFTVLPQLLSTLLQSGELPFPAWAIPALGLLQGAILLAAAVCAGAATAHSVGLRAPVFEAAVSGAPSFPQLKHALLPAVGAGLLTGVFLFLANTYGPEVWVQAQAGYYPSLATRILFGGVTEELLLRWGLMTSLLWVLWRIFQRGYGTPRPHLFWIAIVLSALSFGFAHLPAVAIELGGLSGSVAAFIVAANAATGTVFGWLYWRHGLEAAMIAHSIAHIVNYAASAL